MQTTLQSVTTKTSVYNGAAVDVSGLTGDWTIVVKVQASGADTQSRFSFVDDLGAATPAFVVPPGISKSAPYRVSFRKNDHPDIRVGIAGATLALQLARIAGTNPSITYQAWIES